MIGHVSCRGLCAVLAIVSVAVLAAAQDTPSAGGAAPLTLQQEAVRDRLRQLEDRMATLAQSLADREPEQAARLAEALSTLGERQLRRRVEDTLTLLRHARFDQAGYEQQQVLDDLVAVLELLKRDGSDLAELRAERKRLEAARENVQALHDAQRQAMSDAAARVPFDSPDDYDRAAAEQHDVERQTRDLHEQMREESASERACPGQKEVGQAGECMQQAGEKYEEKQQDAAAEQQQALDELEKAMEKLDEALEQARREEAAQALKELIARFGGMLARQREVERVVTELGERPLADWTRSEQLRVTEAVKQERDITADAEDVLELLASDGTTVVLPDLTLALIDDLEVVTGQLATSDLGPRTRGLVADTIAQMEEILAALEARRPQGERRGSGTCPGQDGQQCAAPLLPGSAELKLLRGAQARVNRQTCEIATMDDARAEQFDALGQRQGHLAELVERMMKQE
ncbi:MAG: hypothetical protein JXO22_14855 [Phycisphaerae bacterium]|nr:hypothetical protein [Phycisphaerae bacterium]